MRGFSQYILLCLEEKQVGYMIKKVQKGIYGIHCRAKVLASNILRSEYYWSTMQFDRGDMYISATSSIGSSTNLISPHIYYVS